MLRVTLHRRSLTAQPRARPSHPLRRTMARLVVRRAWRTTGGDRSHTSRRRSTQVRSTPPLTRPRWDHSRGMALRQRVVPLVSHPRPRSTRTAASSAGRSTAHTTRHSCVSSTATACRASGSPSGACSRSPAASRRSVLCSRTTQPPAFKKWSQRWTRRSLIIQSSPQSLAVLVLPPTYFIAMATSCGRHAAVTRALSWAG
mmetsp:Transcript_51021/g.101503  ORF Transcript_51021/g.101503 Transcript_51021/m.101503 type:complete len:201 (+) Transcript_51021:122-724(+)